jgi:peptidoglycan/xylan/chitin deacetylase (PgdA/CDA1 family)
MQAAGGFAPFRLANRNKALILTYHRFSNSDAPFATSASLFAAHLDYLTSRYRVVSLSTLADLLQSGSTLPRGLAVITIDDGYHDAYNIAFPILRRKQVPATLFAVTGFVDGECWLWPDRVRYAMLNTSRRNVELEIGGRLFDLQLRGAESRLEAADQVNAILKQLPQERKERDIAIVASELGIEAPSLPTKEFRSLSWDLLREMEREGVEIGSHTVTHPILTRVTGEIAERELTASRERLEAELGHKVDLLCYPNGDSNLEIERAAARAGYRAAVTTLPGFNDAETGLLSLRRIPAASDIAHLAQSTSGFEEFKNRLIRTRRAAVL